MSINEILVVCDSGSPKHGKKHPTPPVQGFIYRENMADQMGMGWTGHNRSTRAKRSILSRGDAAQALVGDEHLDRKLHRGQQHRESWNLECAKCGDSVPVRHEKLYPALSKMRELGIERVGLSHFREGLAATS
ncbi:hypothetical protein [Arthrobacter rhombi]|uniref:hypothetical protein n=1 Tax=Arthrobacter rhombi TaxID=71253 RepID=UPI003FD586FC